MIKTALGDHDNKIQKFKQIEIHLIMNALFYLYPGLSH